MKPSTLQPLLHNRGHIGYFFQKENLLQKEASTSFQVLAYLNCIVLYKMDSQKCRLLSLGADLLWKAHLHLQAAHLLLTAACLPWQVT